ARHAGARRREESHGACRACRTPSSVAFESYAVGDSTTSRSDYDAILALHHEAGWLRSRVDGEVWAAWEERELVGSLQFEKLTSDLRFVRAMVVREDSRGRASARRCSATS